MIVTAPYYRIIEQLKKSFDYYSIGEVVQKKKKEPQEFLHNHI